MAITFYLLLLVSGGNDIIASQLHLSINDITQLVRLLVFVLPPLAFVVTKRICLGLQRKDREKVLHGRETGTIYRTETGEFFEVHAPLDEHSQWVLVQHEPPGRSSCRPRSTRTASAAPAPTSTGFAGGSAGSSSRTASSPSRPVELAAAQHEEHHADRRARRGGRGAARQLRLRSRSAATDGRARSELIPGVATRTLAAVSADRPRTAPSGVAAEHRVAPGVGVGGGQAPRPSRSKDSFQAV